MDIELISLVNIVFDLRLNTKIEYYIQFDILLILSNKAYSVVNHVEFVKKT